MEHAERHIIKTYSELFESLSSASKLELLERLVKSIRKDSHANEEEFFSSFGGLVSDKPAEEIIKDIRGSREFRVKELKL